MLNNFSLHFFLIQDGPFLAVRIYLCLNHQPTVVNEPHVFFICKNAIVCMLQLYRFVILMREREDED